MFVRFLAIPDESKIRDGMGEASKDGRKLMPQ